MIFGFRPFAPVRGTPSPARFRCFDDVQKLGRNLTEKGRSESMKRNDEGATLNDEVKRLIHFFIDPWNQ
jgi:hypothetical protein